MVTLFTILFILICPLIVFIVLVQDPKGGGLAGVLGGAGGTSAFGAKTADVVMKTTVVLGIVYFLLALGLGINLRYAPGKALTKLGSEARAEEGSVDLEGEAAPETPEAGAAATEGEAEPAGAAAEVDVPDAPAAEGTGAGGEPSASEESE